MLKEAAARAAAATAAATAAQDPGDPLGSPPNILEIWECGGGERFCWEPGVAGAVAGGSGQWQPQQRCR